MKNCYCCSGKSFSDCCEPLLNGINSASNAEQLMRSRFSAYAMGNFPYILETYGNEQRLNLTESALAESFGNTKWLGLKVVEHNMLSSSAATVEFVATYSEKKQLFQMNELSSFELQGGQWKYTTGVMQNGTGKIKMSRNVICFCGSGKKFKQCCLNKF